MDTHYIWAACAQNGIASLKIYTSYLIDGRVLFRIVTLYAFYNVFDCIDGVCEYKYAKIKGLYSREITSLPSCHKTRLHTINV